MKTRMRVSILTLSLLATTAWTGLASAETVTVTGIEIKGADGFELRVPTIEAVDANVDEAAIRLLFSQDFTKSADMLATLDAAAIRVPEIIVAYDVPDEDGEMSRGQVVYSGFELTGVENGVASRAVIAGTEISGGNAEGGVIAMGTIASDRLDIGGILGFYGLTPNASGETRTIYENFVLEGGTVTSDEVNCIIGSASAETFKARPLKGTFTDLMKYSAELQRAEEEKSEPSPEAIGAVVDFYADLLTAMESSPTLFEGFSCEGKGEDGKDFVLSAGPATMGGMEPGMYPGFSLDNFAMEAQDGWFRLGNVTWKPMDVEDTLENLVEAKGQINEEWLGEHWRFLIPQIEGMSLTDMAMDIPGEGSRVRAAVAAFDLSLGNYVNGIPADIRTSASGIEFDVPDDDEGMVLRAMGIERLSLGYDIAATWNRDDKTIAIEELAVSAGQLGSLKISGTLANAGPELFSERNEVVLAAAMALTATDITIEVENAGVLSLVIAAAAAEEKQAPESFQVVMAGMAQALPLAILGGTPDAVQLSNALGAFMAGTPNLKLTLTAVDPQGLGLAELMAAGDNPAVLKDKVTIAAAASGEPVPFEFPEAAPARSAPPAPPAEPGKTTSSN